VFDPLPVFDYDSKLHLDLNLLVSKQFVTHKHNNKHGGKKELVMLV